MNQVLEDTPTLEKPAATTPDRGPASGRPPRIGIWGHYHGGNLGDDLLVATLISNVRARIPNAEIVGFCLNPTDTRQRHRIPAFAIWRYAERINKPTQAWTQEDQAERSTAIGLWGRTKLLIKRRPWLMRPLCCARSVWRAVVSPLNRLTSPLREALFLTRSYRRLRGTDLLIVAGSGPLFDGWCGAWGHPYALYKWSTLARLCGARLVCLSTGAGPIDSRLSRTFLRRAVRTTSYRSYRDPSSARLIASLGVEGEHPVFPDMGFGLDVSRYLGHWEVPSVARNRTVVGLCVMAHRDPRHMPRNDPPRFGAYIRKMAEFCAWLLRNDSAVLAFSSDCADSRAFADVRAILHREHGLGDDPRLIEPPVNGLSDLASVFSCCDYVIAARYHCIIIPWLLNKPVVGLAYNRKTIDLMASMGQSEYCIDIDRFEVAELVSRFQAMVCNGDAIRAQLSERVAGCRARLAEQYDCVLGPPVVTR